MHGTPGVRHFFVGRFYETPPFATSGTDALQLILTFVSVTT
jgi:hypothetical protein